MTTPCKGLKFSAMVYTIYMYYMYKDQKLQLAGRLRRRLYYTYINLYTSVAGRQRTQTWDQTVTSQCFRPLPRLKALSLAC